MKNGAEKFKIWLQIVKPGITLEKKYKKRWNKNKSWKRLKKRCFLKKMNEK